MRTRLYIYVCIRQRARALPLWRQQARAMPHVRQRERARPYLRRRARALPLCAPTSTRPDFAPTSTRTAPVCA